MYWEKVSIHSEVLKGGEGSLVSEDDVGKQLRREKHSYWVLVDDGIKMIDVTDERQW